jgi:hypothetical protein
VNDTTFPGRVLATVRASSWPGLFDCAHRFYWQDIMGVRGPSSGRSMIGTAVHAGTAVFDQARIDGHHVSVSDAVDASVEALANPREEVAFDEDVTRQDAENFAVKLTTRYCQDIAPTRTYAAVELQCAALDIVTSHGIVRVTGTTDRVRLMAAGQLGISDLKTGARATEKTPEGGRRAVTKGHHLQLGIYTLMAEQGAGRRIDGPAEIVGLQTTKEAPCAVGEIPDVKTPLLGTEDTPGLIEMAAQLLSQGLFPPNPKSFVCSAKYCAAHAHHCKYHD